MINQPACLAPFLSVLIDVNKKVRPCCVYEVDIYPNDSYLGDLRTETISQIRNNKKWIKIKDNLSNQKVTDGCTNCEIREERTGWSLKKDYQNDGTGYKFLDWTDNRLQMIEFNGSNICNLACMHCRPKFSSTWGSLAKKMVKIQALGYKLNADDVVTKSNTELIVKNLNELDISKLQYIMFKGGEPLLNDETLVILEYLYSQGILQQIDIYVTTNGTICDNRMLWLLGQAKFVTFTFSIDGDEKLNPYIRWSKKNFAKLDNIKDNINKLATNPKTCIRLCTSVMTYNVFRLVEIRDWWLEIVKEYPNIVIMDKNAFENIVTTHITSIRNLTDITRNNLIKFYQDAQSELGEFNPVIGELSKEYLGNDFHNRWVDYTLGLDHIRGTSIMEVEPKLVNELNKIYD